MIGGYSHSGSGILFGLPSGVSVVGTQPFDTINGPCGGRRGAWCVYVQKPCGTLAYARLRTTLQPVLPRVSASEGTVIRKEQELFCGPFLWKGEVSDYVRRNQNLKDLKGSADKVTERWPETDRKNRSPLC